MARVKEHEGWLWFNSLRGQNRKSRSSVFFALKPNANACYERKDRKLCFPDRCRDNFYQNLLARPGPALPQVGPLKVVCHQTCVGLETDLPTIQNTKKERFDSETV